MATSTGAVYNVHNQAHCYVCRLPTKPRVERSANKGQAYLLPVCGNWECRSQFTKQRLCEPVAVSKEWQASGASLPT